MQVYSVVTRYTADSALIPFHLIPLISRTAYSRNKHPLLVKTSSRASMEGDGGAHDQEWEPLWSAQCSPASSEGFLQDAGDELEEEQSVAADAEDKVFVALPENFSDGESTLLWALHNLATDGCKIMIAHVHSPAQAIVLMRDHTSMRPEEIKEYRRLKRAEAKKNLDAYVSTAKCTREDLEVGCEKVIIEMDSIAKGLDELIALHSITKLVMGAAADQHYSEEMNIPKSKKAMQLMEKAPPSCTIWFTCNGHLICIRKTNENSPPVPVSPAKTNVPQLPGYSISKQMRSMGLSDLEYELSRSKGTSSSLVATTMTDWGYFFTDWETTQYESSRTDDADSIFGSTTLPMTVGDTNEVMPMMHSPTHDADNVYLKPVPTCDWEHEPSVDEELHNKLHDPCTKAEPLKDDSNQGANKLRKVEMDLLLALQRIKESEDSYLHELSQRKEIEKTLATQKLEIDEMKRCCCTLYDELKDLKKQKIMLEQNITQIKSAAKEHEEEIKEKFIKQLCKESKKCQKIEVDLLSAIQRIKEAESSYRNEKTERRNMEDKVARQRMEIEEIRRWRDILFYELQDVKEQKLKLERVDATEETNRRRKAETDLISALHRTEDLEHRLTNEMKKKEAMEETITRQHKEIEETKRQLHDVQGNHMTEIKSTIKVHEEKLADSNRLVQKLQAKFNKLLHKRDTTVIEFDILHQKHKQRVSITTEFSFVELHQATKGFDAGLKIGEDECTCTYRGFLRNTIVAIKLLDPQRLQGEAEFHQQVANIATIRHPNLVTLVGACPEAFALVYEFLPNGSLKDRLLCKKSTLPLSWKASNILLDANLVCKLGDLGIGQPLKQSNITTANLRHHRTKEFKLWSDVHSFGIITLQLLIGRSSEKIAEKVQEAMDKAQLHLIMDASAGDWPFVQAKKLADLGLRCTNLSGRGQPDLAKAWEVIEPLMKAATLANQPSTFALPSDDTSAPSHFICPILQEVMSDPHIAADGFTYEAQSIRGWLDSGRDTSPMTNLKLAHRGLTPNRALRSAILEWGQQ
ncbi:hypothetical protein QOZ80_2BG0195840 [Eleusine coracana subsp. coracana]|nr:hypothetical protein QOZ80_2BG0195840 [Eleusine coracana subsp. coracana]